MMMLSHAPLAAPIEVAEEALIQPDAVELQTMSTTIPTRSEPEAAEEAHPTTIPNTKSHPTQIATKNNPYPQRMRVPKALPKMKSISWTVWQRSTEKL